MKKDIHPKYEEASVICGCGEKFKTRSTKKEIRVEICSKCHPFYTGTQKFVDAAGMVERFEKKYGWTKSSEKKPATASAAPAATQKTTTETQEPAPQNQDTTPNDPTKIPI